MKKKTKNTNQKRANTSKGTYNLDEYRSKKSNQSRNSSASSNVQKKINPYDSKTYYNPYGTYKTESSEETNKRYNPYSYTNDSYANPYNQSSYTNNKRKDPQLVREEIKQKNKISRKESEQLKRKKKSMQRKKIVATIFAVMLGVYGSIKLVEAFMYPTVSYQTVRTGIIDNSQKVQGIIVREEIVYTSESEGSVHYLTGEGQKVRKDGEVCYVAKDDELNKVTEQIEDVDVSIYNIQDKRENLAEYQTEIYNLNNGITNEIKDFYNNRAEKTNAVYTLRKQLDRIVQTRTDLYVNEASERTESLQQNRLTLTNELKAYHDIILSKESGTVSYVIDGQEALLKSSEIDQLNFETYKNLVKDKKVNESNKSVGQTTNDSPLYKLITDDKWQIVTYVDADKSSQFTENEFYDLIFEDMGNARVNFKLTAKVEEGENVKLLFTTRDQMVKFLPYRSVEFTIGENKSEGLKIPLSAIVEKNVLRIPTEYIIQKDKEQGVMKQTGELVEFVPINVQYTKDESSYILQDLGDLKSVQVNQSIVKSESKEGFVVSEVAAVQGVYTINGRYAKFKQVDIVLVNEDYAIIKADSQLKEFDQIISNPKSIKEDQLLKSMNIQNE